MGFLRVFRTRWKSQVLGTVIPWYRPYFDVWLRMAFTHRSSIGFCVGNPFFLPQWQQPSVLWPVMRTNSANNSLSFIASHSSLLRDNTPTCGLVTISSALPTIGRRGFTFPTVGRHFFNTMTWPGCTSPSFASGFFGMISMMTRNSYNFVENDFNWTMVDMDRDG